MIDQQSKTIEEINKNLNKGTISWDASKKLIVFSKKAVFDEYLDLIENNASLSDKIKTSMSKQLLIKSNESDLISALPYSYHLALNTKGECIIENKYILYRGDGIKYYAESSDAITISDLSTNNFYNSNKIEKFDFGYSRVNSNLKSARTSLEDFGNNDGDARHQYQFTQQYPVIGTRKYIHELITFRDYNYGLGGYDVTLEMKIKMEYLGSNGWKTAGENRNINYNFTYNGVYHAAYLGGSPRDLTFNNTISSNFNTTSNQVLQLVKLYGVYMSSDSTPWDVTVNGYIEQHVIGDASYNKWTNTGYPLW